MNPFEHIPQSKNFHKMAKLLIPKVIMPLYNKGFGQTRLIIDMLTHERTPCQREQDNSPSLLCRSPVDSTCGKSNAFR